MRILIALPRLHTNQNAWYKTLRAHGHEVMFITSYATNSGESEAIPNNVITQTITPLPYRAALKVWELLRGKKPQPQYLVWPESQSLRSKVTHFSPDLVLIRECLTPLSLKIQQQAARLSVPTIQYTQSPLHQRDSLISRLLRIFKIIPQYRLSPTLLDEAKVTDSKTFYLPLFVDTEVNKIKRTGENVQLLFVGKYNSRRKNHLLLLEAFSVVSKESNISLTLVGSTVFPDENYYKEIKKAIRSLGLEGRVNMLNDIPPSKMTAVYQDHDVFVLPSVQEPFSISPLEAMANGLPAIVTDSNGCRFHIQNNMNGFVIKSNDLNSLVMALREVIDPEKVDTLKANALKYSKELNNADTFINEFNEMTKTVV